MKRIFDLIIFKVITIWVQIRDIYLYFFRHAIIINAYVDDHTWKGIHHRNWGDDLNYYFIKLLTGRPVITFHNFRLARLFYFKNYLCIGTLLDGTGYKNKSTIVWGAGASGEERCMNHPKNICSVRGPLTQKYVLSQILSCSNIYGDPALLLSCFYKPAISFKQYRLGIIPHVVDLNSPVLENVKKTYGDAVLIINLQDYNKWTDVIDEVCSCQMIASSSLHGLIISDAYNVPNAWIELSGNISGGYFKFRDYGSSVGHILENPLRIVSVDNVNMIDNICKDWKPIKVDVDAILSVCPFNIKKHRIYNG